MPTPFVRPYDPATDFEAVLRIFRETADTAFHHEPTWSYAEYLWIRPYVALTPETCFVLDDGSGTAVGYVIGCADTAGFAARWRTVFVPALDPAAVPPPPTDAQPAFGSDPGGAVLRWLYHDSDSLLNLKFAALQEHWPAHLHIDIREAWQGHGYGRTLIRQFTEDMRSKGVPGVHLSMAAHNEGAGVFYRRLGFRRFPEVVDGGNSGELGRTEGSIILVLDLGDDEDAKGGGP